ncbi:uncharacterized protein MYCFIDRAFT_195575 [Pseudocercospora fijiensis CIRAD86]|uniref:Uncharacterized protein n=1 Tax=Pseudocercospora fijiensis (strain CIRAD86) TaxID=383855 RepID=M2Z416_PSEFD|nr:uncharacterized protein MYCFIDRAFT_195575 [Pseudocercospora fijiensis CIRAD86]EME84565.1 hypothetical protein MYCFIDRAFT_195575 [Pseudocercospora fijiensis CIRAD86]
MSPPEQEIVISLPDLDFLPGASKRQKTAIRAAHEALWLRYEKSGMVGKEKKWRDIINASRELIIAARIPIQRHVNEIRAELDPCWQAYLDIGVKFFLNIPTAIYGAGIEDMLPSYERTLLRFIYEIEPQSTLMNFAAAQKRIDELDVALTNGLFRQVTEILDDLRDCAEDMGEDWEKIEACYEAMLAAANSLRTSGRLSTGDRFMEEDRTAQLLDWAVLVQAFACRTPREFQQYANEREIYD